MLLEQKELDWIGAESIQQLTKWQILKENEEIKLGVVFKKNQEAFLLKENQKPSSLSSTDLQFTRKKSLIIITDEANLEEKHQPEQKPSDSKLEIKNESQNPKEEGGNLLKGRGTTSEDSLIFSTDFDPSQLRNTTKTDSNPKETQRLLTSEHKSQKKLNVALSLKNIKMGHYYPKIACPGPSMCQRPSSENRKQNQKSQNASMNSGKASTSIGISQAFFGLSAPTSQTERLSSSKESRKLLSALDALHVERLSEFFSRNQTHLMGVPSLNSIQTQKIFKRKVEGLEKKNRELLKENSGLKKKLKKFTESIQKSSRSSANPGLLKLAETETPKLLSARLLTSPIKGWFFTPKPQGAQVAHGAFSPSELKREGIDASMSLKNAINSFRSINKNQKEPTITEFNTKQNEKSETIRQESIKNFWANPNPAKLKEKQQAGQIAKFKEKQKRTKAPNPSSSLSDLKSTQFQLLGDHHGLFGKTKMERSRPKNPKRNSKKKDKRIAKSLVSLRGEKIEKEENTANLKRSLNLLSKEETRNLSWNCLKSTSPDCFSPTTGPKEKKKAKPKEQKMSFLPINSHYENSKIKSKEPFPFGGSGRSTTTGKLQSKEKHKTNKILSPHEPHDGLHHDDLQDFKGEETTKERKNENQKGEIAFDEKNKGKLPPKLLELISTEGKGFKAERESAMKQVK